MPSTAVASSAEADHTAGGEMTSLRPVVGSSGLPPIRTVSVSVVGASAA